MKLLIAEKPSVANKDFQALLQHVEGETFQKRDGFLQGKEWVISWAVGHLVGLEYPAAYGFEKWDQEDLPIIPEQWKLRLNPETKKQFHILSDLMTKADMIVSGTDAGREGELIYGLIKMLVQPKGKELRLWVNSFVMEDMQKAWRSLKPLEEYRRLFDSAYHRSISDWLIGINASRGYALKYGLKNFSVGRVQTPTLNLIVQRDLQVENWQDKKYYQLKADWDHFSFTYYNEENESKFVSPEHLSTVLNDCRIGNQYKEATLRDLQMKEGTTEPPLPFDLAELQKECNKKFSLKAVETLDIAQRLYEKKLISYPRTDSNYLPESMKDEVFNLVQSFVSPEQKQHLKEKNDSSKVFNSSKVTDHYAIIPTGFEKEIDSLTERESNVYREIIKRFVLCLGKKELFKKFSILISVNNKHSYKSNEKVVLYGGFTLIYPGESNGENKNGIGEDSFEHLLPGYSDRIKEMSINEITVKPPAYYTEATLLDAMLTAGKSIEDNELKEAMKERGLGTPATRADVIQILFKRGFIINKGKSLISTDLGRYLVAHIDERLVSAELTGEWEKKLRDIERGSFDTETFNSEIIAYLKEISADFKGRVKIGDIVQLPGQFNVPCPVCKNKMKLNKGGVFCESCDFKIWRKIAGKMLSDSVLEQLVSKGKTNKLKGFKSKLGKSFEAKLLLKGTEIKFEFT